MGKFFVRQYELHKISPCSQKNKKITITQVVGKLIHYKLYKNIYQQIGENLLSGVCFFASSFLNALPIPRQDQGNLNWELQPKYLMSGLWVESTPYTHP